MTEKEIRNKVIKTAKKYDGAVTGNKKHKEIVDVFNLVRPDGHPMDYAGPWCAAFVSGVEIEALGVNEAKKICPLSYNCGTIISKAKKAGTWIESDSHKPKPADWILYDWQDSGAGDNTNAPDHVGLVEKVDDGIITVIEGNKRGAYGIRKLLVNGRYIRGFVAIPYSKPARASGKPAEIKAIKKGSTVRIRKGANQYGTTKKFAAFVYDRKYKVIEVVGSRAVIADGKTVIGAVNKNDCINV